VTDTHVSADVAVIGGGLGGVAAALALARTGRTVVLSEETAWLGGQLTSQAVPPDEHAWIEQFGATASYRRLRDGIRDHYRAWYPLTAAARSDRYLNPGAGWVSKLCHEPRVALAVIEAMLAPHRAAGRVRVLLHHRPVAATTDGDRVTSVTVEGPARDRVAVTAFYVLDATETGALLPLAGTEYVTGFESRQETGEPSAPARPQPRNMQAFTVCFVVEHRDGEDHTIDKPSDYAFWRDYQPDCWPGRQLGWTAPHPHTLEPQRHTFTPNPDDDPQRVVADPSKGGGPTNLWLFRRIAARRNFTDGAYPSDLCLVNWPMIDYLEGPLFEVDDDEAAANVEAARGQSMAMLFWMQTEAPRPDGGTGWPGLRLVPEVTGTADGLAMAPYVRESRRIRAEYTVVEQDLSLAVRGGRGAVSYRDSVGIGMYRIDLHPSTGGDSYIDVGSCPYEIPLGALLPERVDNLLPAGKALGTTHITNGCYRLHPTEWNVGEVAGLLAGYCLDHGVPPRAVRADDEHLAAFTAMLDRQGIERRWPAVRGY
jgi:hypothetical protein